MKKGKQILATFLAVILLFSTAPLTGLDSIIAPKVEATYSVGDHIQYGNYPQSEVTDPLILAMLDSMSKNWISYKYYSGSGSTGDGKMVPADYMYYADLDIDGDGLRDYRAVRIDEYRQYGTGLIAGDIHTYQEDNGYVQGNTCYFKFEPIEWRILDPEEGLIVTEKIIDSQAYCNYVLSSNGEYWGDSEKTYYANNYYNSSIRKWLNEDFYNTTFTASQANNIKNDVSINNDAFSTEYSAYNSPATKDKIFLLSYDEVKNTTYGFDSSEETFDVTRMAQGTDYAKAQGLRVSTSSSSSGNSYWWLRSARFRVNACLVDPDGNSAGRDYSSVVHTDVGVRPVCRLLNLTSDISKTEVCNNTGSGTEGTCTHQSTSFVGKKDATCISAGYTGDVTCNNCGLITIEGSIIDKLGHQNTYSTKGTAATCTEDGVTPGIVCKDCGTVISRQEIEKATGHKIVNVNSKPVTETEKGYTGDLVCENCGEVFETGAIIPVGSALKPEDYPYLNSEDFQHRNNGKNWDFWYENDCFVNGTQFRVEEVTIGTDYDSFNNKHKNNKFKMYDLSAQVGEMAVQPNGDIWIALPLPGNFNPETTVIYYVNGDTLEKIPCFIKDEKIYFKTNHFSSYAIVDLTCVHSLKETVVNATCTSEGTKTYTCTACGKVISTEKIAKLEHTYTKTSVKEPTCSEKGYTTYTCSDCGETYKDNYTNTTGHNYDNGTCRICGKNCSCNCHKSGFMGFIWKIINFFQKIFKNNQYCACGAKHW